jgi:TolB-like protein
MPSIIPEYEYDIFISYRHNDNRSGWVTAFVNNLKVELAATVKEPVSLYFDSNPYDGLLETHNVDKSLESKLKSVIFIPILSQTYCDKKSFAWKYEFCVFNKLALGDKFRRDIKLNHGNVASRILPIKINDLDVEDKSTVETEIGGALRAIEFIYREPGVNRPLISTDNKADNQNKTDYRNQLNKLANAIKEILYSVARPTSYSGGAENIAVVQSETLDSRPSIAVLPFTNMSSNADQEYFSDGITENIIIELAANRNLKTISRTSVMRYKRTTKSAPEIAAELAVSYILEGGVQVHGNKVRINVQLVDALKDDLTWSKVFVESMDDIFEIQNNVAEVVAKELLASIGAVKSEPLEEVPTKNLKAYDLFLKGRHAFNQWGVEGYKVASDYYEQAIALDPEFKQAYSALASAYSARMSWNGDLAPHEAQIHIEKYLAEAWRRGASVNDYHTKAFVAFFINKDFASAKILLIQSIAMGPNDANVMYTYSYLLDLKR